MPDSARIGFARRIASGDASLRLYAILDAESCARHNLPLLDVAKAWRDAGVQLVQYRDKTAPRHALLQNAVALRKIFPKGEAFLLLNDHPDLVPELEFDGAHVGQGDLGVQRARAQLGRDRMLGISTHTADQALAASATDVDYVAIGPVFITATKPDAAPPVGICGVQAAKAVTRKPLVAIGGIARTQCRQVLLAGADAVVLISALLPQEPGICAVKQRAQDILAGLK